MTSHRKILDRRDFLKAAAGSAAVLGAMPNVLVAEEAAAKANVDEELRF